MVLDAAFYLAEHVVMLAIGGLAEHEKCLVFVICTRAELRLILFCECVIRGGNRLSGLYFLTLQIRAQKSPEQLFHFLNAICGVYFRKNCKSSIPLGLNKQLELGESDLCV